VPLPELPGPLGTVDVARMLLDRERSLSTYVGRGIAIPHARVDGLERPIAIGHSRLRRQPAGLHDGVVRMIVD
jgi:mannitol/fructose-specific phosphotransferase system IIA component